MHFHRSFIHSTKETKGSSFFVRPDKSIHSIYDDCANAIFGKFGLPVSPIWKCLRSTHIWDSKYETFKWNCNGSDITNSSLAQIAAYNAHIDCCVNAIYKPFSHFHSNTIVHYRTLPCSYAILSNCSKLRCTPTHKYVSTLYVRLDLKKENNAIKEKERKKEKKTGTNTHIHQWHRQRNVQRIFGQTGEQSNLDTRIVFIRETM